MNITDKTWTKHSSWLFVRGRLWSADESFVKEPGMGCQSFTLRSLRSFEKNFWSCRHEGRERRLCLALRMCHRRLMAPCERKKTHMVLRASLRQNLWHKHILTQTHPDTDRNCCCHLLRILSALSISSSKVVFTDRLCGDRSLSAAWPVIFRSAGVGKHLELQPPSIYSTWLGVMDMFSLLLQGHSGSGGKCS